MTKTFLPVATVLLMFPWGALASEIVPPKDRSIKPLTLDLIRQVDEAAEETERYSEGMKIGQDFPLEPHNGQNDPWSDVLQITRLDNPLVTHDCRAEAVKLTLADAPNPEMAKKHAEEEAHKWVELREGEREMELSDYMAHLKKCKNFCGRYVSELLRCHLEGVQERPRMIVLFDVGRPRAYEADRFAFSTGDESNLRTFAQAVLRENSKVLLMSRASILNPDENPFENEAVATRRASTVRRALVQAGIPQSDIQTKVLTWEPPRLHGVEMSRAYGFTDRWHEVSNKRYMDQSVVLVAYREESGGSAGQ